ncbi:hypothetical protein BLOT_013751 [Blomia tropicalis]|nr:hypothetical protein BLOT_013751 [Blomia tropicalis]
MNFGVLKKSNMVHQYQFNIEWENAINDWKRVKTKIAKKFICIKQTALLRQLFISIFLGFRRIRLNINKILT